MRRRQKLKPTDVPQSLLVLGTAIPVILKSFKTAPDEAVQYGEFVAEDMAIYINTYHPLHNLHDTLLHELLHAALHISGVSVFFDGANNQLEEAVVRAITHTVLAAFDIKKLEVGS